jgi:hypothetical protein
MSDSLHQNCEAILTKGNVVLRAVFALKSYTLTIGSGEGGTVWPSGDTVVAHGSEFTVIASSISGFTFLKWIVESGSAELQDSLSMQTGVILTQGNAAIKAIFQNDNSSLTGISSVLPNSFGLWFSMSGNVPVLKYAVPASADGHAQNVDIRMLDIRGRTVFQIKSGSVRPGYYTVNLSLPNGRNAHAASGFYICRMISGGYRGVASIPVVR